MRNPKINFKKLLSWFLILALFNPNYLLTYPIVSNECKDDPVKCAMESKLDKIVIYGAIGRDDAELIAAVDSVLWFFQKFPTIYLDSPGGSVQSAVQIGRIFRKRDATVISGSPFFEETFVECSSACVDLAAGATKRHLWHIGIHNSHISKFLGPRKWSRIPAPQEAVEEDLKYFDEMGINPEIKKIIHDTPLDQMKHIFFNSNKSRDSQKIIQLGFIMPNGPPLPELKHTLTSADFITVKRTRYINAINYGSNAAIRDFVNETLETDAGQETNYAEANIWLQVGAD